MDEPQFWRHLADRITGVLRSSRDNTIRFLWVDGFDTGTGRILAELGRNLVTAPAWVYGGKISVYTARLHLSGAAVELWRNGEWAKLLPAVDGPDWLSIRPEEGCMGICLNGSESCNHA